MFHGFNPGDQHVDLTVGIHLNTILAQQFGGDAAADFNPSCLLSADDAQLADIGMTRDGKGASLSGEVKHGGCFFRIKSSFILAGLVSACPVLCRFI
ncbi:hypothetical protein ACUTQ5_02725 [Serratia sp. NA_112.1]|uniref:hypothetical protein n=1 Tax=Serratia sp. NA_112.1 TaxID=3415665 RepID=UPI004046BA6A